MDKVNINGTEINYQITFKRNKNTYFYFKKQGYIQINASRFQKKKEIMKYMQDNSESFIKKYTKLLEIKQINEGYKIWGNIYNIIPDNVTDKVIFDHEIFEVKEPNIVIDHVNEYYKIEEKSILLIEAEMLKDKYMNNGLIDISKIIIKTRYTSSRFGSCNYRLKTINLNLKLVHFDKKFIEYVFLHEIAHLVHQNHSVDFYNLLEKICPNYKILKKELNLKFKR